MSSKCIILYNDRKHKVKKGEIKKYRSDGWKVYISRATRSIGNSITLTIILKSNGYKSSFTTEELDEQNLTKFSARINHAIQNLKDFSLEIKFKEKENQVKSDTYACCVYILINNN
jgi:hypothetical protein